MKKLAEIFVEKSKKITLANMFSTETVISLQVILKHLLTLLEVMEF